MSFELTQAISPEQTELICAYCNETVYTCDECGEYIDVGQEIYCDNRYAIIKHYCLDCAKAIEKI